MSVTLMAASCDSIGTCSLDVDAESLSETLGDSTQVDSSLNRRNAGERQANAPSLSEQTLHSLLLSAGTNGGGQNSENPDIYQANLSTPSPTTAKKPSYLNLACSISGYGGITTYDSKLREGFRSRDHSPGKLVGIQNGSREASPARGLAPGASGNFLVAPNSGKLCWTPSPVGIQVPAKTDMKHISPTSRGGQRINGTNGSDQTDATGNFNAKRISDQRNRWLESTLSPSEKNDYQQKVVSVFETKAGRHGLTTETSVETRYEVNSRSQATVVSSTTVISSSSIPQNYSSTLRTERIIPIGIEEGSSDRHVYLSDKQVYSNGSGSHQTPVSTKSFIQQRIERLYGPCALAQGFFQRSSKSPPTPPNSHGTNGISSQANTDVNSSSDKLESSPELPVLRHLRPEFRDQLAVAPRRSLGAKFSNGSSPSNSSESKLASPSGKAESISIIPQILQRSTESIADLQPAAPEVVLPQQSSSIPPMNKADDSVKLEADTNGSAEVFPVQDSKPFPTVNVADNSASVVPVAPGISADEQKEENAGHKFLRIQRQTIEKLLELAEKAEKEIEQNVEPPLSEEALGHLRAAAGKARLLATQKMVQFEGLCHKCINQHPEEPFPTTPEDLQGFWDMLLLQVEQVHNSFHRLDKLRAVGWCEDKLVAEDPPKSAEISGPHAPGSASKRTPRTPKSTASNSAKSAEAAALRKQREEDRRKIMEQRRRELKQKQQREQDSSASQDKVEIFGSQPS